MITTLVTVREQIVVEAEEYAESVNYSNLLVDNGEYILDELQHEESCYTRLVSADNSLVFQVEYEEDEQLRDIVVLLTYVILSLGIFNYSISISDLF